MIQERFLGVVALGLGLSCALSLQAVVSYLPVARQQGLTCGAHALKNGFALAYPRHGNLLGQSLDTPALLSILNGNQGEQQRLYMRNNRYPHRMRRPRFRSDLNNLSTEEVITLAEHAYNAEDQCVAVLEDLDRPQDFLNDLLVYAQINLRNENGRYVFIINSAKTVFKGTKATATDGHWIAVRVTRRANGFDYEVADSLRGQSTMVINQLDAILHRFIFAQPHHRFDHVASVQRQSLFYETSLAYYRVLKKRTFDLFNILINKLNALTDASQKVTTTVAEDTSNDACIAQTLAQGEA